MYDELERLKRAFEADAERCENIILRGGDAVSDITAYKVKCAELKIWRLALKAVLEIRQDTLQKEFALEE
jgi:hypothetical protein